MVKKKTLLAAVLIPLLVAVAAALLSKTVVIRNYAAVKTIGVEAYWDYNATNPCIEINWGLLDPGESVNKTIYVKSVSNVPSTLNMTTQNWSPSNASNYIKLTWDSEGKTILPHEIIPVTLLMKVETTISGIENFSFDIIISATG
jgi:hypothetical protein